MATASGRSNQNSSTMRNVDLYLHFNGTSEKAMTFYKKIFGGEFIAVQRYRDMPGSEKMPTENRDKIVHMSLKVAEGTTIMASDVVSDESGIQFGNSYHICLQASTEKEADKLFAHFSEGGRIEMPMNKTFWGAYFGMCIDQFGVQWMINCSDAK